VGAWLTVLREDYQVLTKKIKQKLRRMSQTEG